MSTPTLTTGVAAPFSLTIRGSRLSHNLLALQPRGINDPDIGNHPDYQRPYVLPESVTLEQSADNIGGTLSFTIEEPATLGGNLSVTPNYGPWFRDGKLPDNAIVEYSQGAEVDPNLLGQTRLFVGFIDQIEIDTNGGGQGTKANVTCVSTNTILDRIIVRKPIGPARRGLAAGKVTIKAGSDAYQIKRILKLAGSLRKYGPLVIFNPGNYKLIADTGVTLPKLEVQPGTLRSALESVVEAAQEKDGKRRSFHVDPATGALTYGFAVSEIGAEAPTAPWEIVDRPEDEVNEVQRTTDFDQTVRGLRPAFFYRLDESTGPALNKPTSGTSKSKTAALKVDPFTGGPVDWRITGPFDNAEPRNYGVDLNASNISGAHPSAAITGDRALEAWMKRRTRVSVGGEADGMVIGIEEFAPYRFYYQFAGITYTTSVTAEDGVWFNMRLDYRAADGRLRFTARSPYGEGCTETTTAVSDSTAPTTQIRAIGYEVGPITFFNRVNTDGAYDAAITAPVANRIMARNLRITLDHSRIVKSALLLTADSAADADTDPDPYLRSYDALKNSAGTGRAFPARPGPRFEAIVEASTIRNPGATARSNHIDRIARAFFTTRRKPESGIEFQIRGARWFYVPDDLGADTFYPGQGYGFSGGWRVNDAGGYVYVKGWKPGQFVAIKNDALGIYGQYQIVSVTQTFEPGSFIRTFRIACENRPKNSVARLLVAE